MPDQPIILAIESAIRGGSLALSRGSEIIDIWLGGGGVSRAEDLLWNIDEMLMRNHIAKQTLAQVVVSVGPGSFTGIRIGLATAMGIATALDIKLAKYSILQAMVASQSDGEPIITAVPVGRGVVCKQAFRKNVSGCTALTEPISITDEQFEQELLQNPIITVDNFTSGLAICLINAANDSRIDQANEPLFISKPTGI